MKLYDLILKSAKNALQLQREDGSFPKGHNGPWNNEVTPIRTTAHWSLLLYKAYQVSDNSNFLQAGIKGCDYLLSKESRPFEYTFYCLKDHTSRSNGLIGQAWAVEPLIFIGKDLGRKEYLLTAKEVLTQHPFDNGNHAWIPVDINGEKQKKPHSTLNQQVWFSTMALVLGDYIKNQYLKENALDFFQNLPSIVEFWEDGLIKKNFSINQGFKIQIKKLLKIVYDYTINISTRAKRDKSAKKMSFGYLPFLLYGLALAYRYKNEEEFWKREKLKKIISSAIDFAEHNYPYMYKKNEYAWQYNPVGIEMPFVLETFCDYLDLENSEDRILKWLRRQLNNHYQFEKGLMVKNTSDPNVLSSRFYESIRLENYNI